MTAVLKKGHTYGGNGFNWPQSRDGTTGSIFDVFGPQPLDVHLFSTGYSYDFHRGIDVFMTSSQPQYACMNGIVHRADYTHFWWEYAENLNEFIEVDTSGSATFAVDTNLQALEIVCTRDGVKQFPAGVARLEASRQRAKFPMNANDWTIEMKISGTMSVTGSVGVGVWREDVNEYAAIGYDGATITCRGRDALGAMTNDGTTSGVLGPSYVSIYYDQGTDTITWRYSNNGTQWATIASEAGHTFTSGSIPFWTPFVYWQSTDTDAATHTVHLDQVNWYSENDNIGIFGNWVVIQNADRKFGQIHLGHVDVQMGDIVTCGDLIGRTGYTGFNARTGRNLGSHAHIEYYPTQNYFYDNDQPVNPLAAGILPRDTSLDSFTISSSYANDPSGSGSHRIFVEVDRANQGFVLNEIELTGSVANRRINFDTRFGLNVDNDVPIASGVYIEPSDFNVTASTYRCAFYFQTATVGPTLTSYTVRASENALIVSGVDELGGVLDDSFDSQATFNTDWIIEKPAAISSSIVSAGELNLQVNGGGAGATNSFWFDANDGIFVYIPVTGSFDARTRVRVRNTANTANPPATNFRICGLAVHDMDRTNLNYLHIGAGATSIGTNSIEWKTTDDNGGITDVSAFNSTAFPAATSLNVDLRIVRHRSNLQLFDLYWRPTTGSVPLYVDDAAWRNLITINRQDNTQPSRSGNGASANLAIALPENVGVGFTIYSNLLAHDIRGFFEDFQIRRDFS